MALSVSRLRVRLEMLFSLAAIQYQKSAGWQRTTLAATLACTQPGLDFAALNLKFLVISPVLDLLSALYIEQARYRASLYLGDGLTAHVAVLGEWARSELVLGSSFPPPRPVLRGTGGRVGRFSLVTDGPGCQDEAPSSTRFLCKKKGPTGRRRGRSF